jgi:hypothetical protein
VQCPNLELCQHRDNVVVLVERVHLPPGLNRPTDGHHELVTSSWVVLNK